MTPKERVAQAAWLKILLLEELPTPELYLHGSVSKVNPFFPDASQANFSEDSDFDFATPHSRELVVYLESNGWEPKPESDYQDMFTQRVYEKQVDGCKVQLSLRTSFVQFKEAWESVSFDFYWSFLNKRSPTYIGRDGVMSYINQMYALTHDFYKVRSVRSGLVFHKVAVEAVPAFDAAPAAW